jgi:hypothetical protein
MRLSRRLEQEQKSGAIWEDYSWKSPKVSSPFDLFRHIGQVIILDVRHEVASVLEKELFPVFCHRYPSGSLALLVAIIIFRFFG